MKKIPLTQGKFALVDDEDYEWLNQWKWCASKEYFTFYAKKGVKRNGLTRSFFMHREIMRTPKGLVTDHLDNDGLNNQKSNLRIVTTSQNMMNRSRLQKNNKSGVSGVRWSKSYKKWEAAFTYEGKEYRLGVFDCVEDAAMAVINFSLPD